MVCGARLVLVARGTEARPNVDTEGGRLGRGIVDLKAVLILRWRGGRLGRGVVDLKAVLILRWRGGRLGRGTVDLKAVLILRWRGGRLGRGIVYLKAVLIFFGGVGVAQQHIVAAAAAA
ncbi:unnamed protein product [Ectocarpus sp. 6 AP-2014]